MSPLATLMLYLVAGTTLGLLALLSGIPAAPLAGALLGAGIVSMSGQLDQAVWPTGTRTILEIVLAKDLGSIKTITPKENFKSRSEYVEHVAINNDFQFLDVGRFDPNKKNIEERKINFVEIYGDYNQPEASNQSHRCLD